MCPAATKISTIIRWWRRRRQEGTCNKQSSVYGCTCGRMRHTYERRHIFCGSRSARVGHVCRCIHLRCKGSTNHRKVVGNSLLRCLALSEGMNKHIYPPSLFSVQERELLLPCDGYTMQTSLAITLSCSPCLLHPLPNCFFSLPYTTFCLIKPLFFLSTSLVSFA